MNSFPGESSRNARISWEPGGTKGLISVVADITLKPHICKVGDHLWRATDHCGLNSIVAHGRTPDEAYSVWAELDNRRGRL